MLMKDMINDQEFAEQLNKFSQLDADQIITGQYIDTSGLNIQK